SVEIGSLVPDNALDGGWVILDVPVANQAVEAVGPEQADLSHLPPGLVLAGQVSEAVLQQRVDRFPHLFLLFLLLFVCLPLGGRLAGSAEERQHQDKSSRQQAFHVVAPFFSINPQSRPRRRPCAARPSPAPCPSC